MVHLYSPPLDDLLQDSSNTIWSCVPLGLQGALVVDIYDIKSVVAMVPHPTRVQGDDLGGRFFVVEKPGLELALMSGVQEDVA
jgi:hypothetical protein